MFAVKPIGEFVD
jgi:predicted tellurium resistance membrane protein TerC